MGNVKTMSKITKFYPQVLSSINLFKKLLEVKAREVLGIDTREIKQSISDVFNQTNLPVNYSIVFSSPSKYEVGNTGWYVSHNMDSFSR